MKNVCMIVGSLRKESFNRQLAGEVEALMEGRAQVSYLAWEDLPLMNQDIEFPAPPAVQRVRDAITAADGIWICSPEYNFQIPGGLKNLLDWLSRSLIPNDPDRGSAIKGKVAAMAGAGGSFAVASMRARLEELLKFIGVEVVGGQGFGFALGAEAWGSNVLGLTDEARAELAELVDAFLTKIEA